MSSSRVHRGATGLRREFGESKFLSKLIIIMDMQEIFEAIFAIIIIVVFLGAILPMMFNLNFISGIVFLVSMIILLAGIILRIIGSFK